MKKLTKSIKPERLASFICSSMKHGVRTLFSTTLEFLWTGSSQIFSAKWISCFIFFIHGVLIWLASMQSWHLFWVTHNFAHNFLFPIYHICFLWKIFETRTKPFLVLEDFHYHGYDMILLFTKIIYVLSSFMPLQTLWIIISKMQNVWSYHSRLVIQIK